MPGVTAERRYDPLDATKRPQIRRDLQLLESLPTENPGAAVSFCARSPETRTLSVERAFPHKRRAFDCKAAPLLAVTSVDVTFSHPTGTLSVVNRRSVYIDAGLPSSHFVPRAPLKEKPND